MSLEIACSVVKTRLRLAVAFDFQKIYRVISRLFKTAEATEDPWRPKLAFETFIILQYSDLFSIKRPLHRLLRFK